MGPTCTTTCGTEKYGDTSDRTCKDCGSDCDACTDDTTCTTCSTGFYNSNGECVSTCPTNSIVNGGDCDHCDTGCSTCDTIISNCTSCSSGYFLDGTTCVTDCGDGNYGDTSDSTCKACDLTVCTKCISFEKCTECIPSKILASDGTCGDNCLSGYFEDQHSASDRFCRSCPSTCTS